MLSHISLQKKIAGSVFVIMTVCIVTTAIGVTFFAKTKFQKIEFKRIYDETYVIKKKLGHLMSESNRLGMMAALEKFNLFNNTILYFVISDTTGSVFLSSDEALIGKKQFEVSKIKDMSRPVFNVSNVDSKVTTPCCFRIYKSRLNKDLFEESTLIASKNEIIFDAFWDLTYNNKSMGTFRMGFSQESLNKHLGYLTGGILGIGFLVLMLSLGLVLWMVKKNLAPLDTILKELTRLDRADEEDRLRQKLGEISFIENRSDIDKIQELKRTILKIKDQLILNWDQLENHKAYLEKIVDDKNSQLNKVNRKLARQMEERKEIENRLLNVQKLEAISTLAGGIAHEFNNLFMAITGYAALIEKQSEPGHPNAVKAEKIRALVDNGSQSIKQLLGFARSGKYMPGPLNLNEVLRVNVDMFQRSRKDLEVITNFIPNIWNVYADRSQMEHVLMNLLLNASESTPENGRIKIETNNIMLEKKRVRMNKIVSGRFVHFSVKDDGKGIEKEHIQRVFDPFFTTKPMSAGTGLGLASVYGIVDNHDGFTTVESSVGKGAVFNVFLPAMKQETEKNG